MLYNYKEALKLYGSDYKLKKGITNKEIYLVEKGIYSDNKNNFDIYELLLKKYPTSFLVKESAFYKIGFIKDEPTEIHLGTNRNAVRIRDIRVKQHFYSNFDKTYNEEYYVSRILSCANIMTYVTENGNEIRILSLNALLYDLIRTRKEVTKEFFEEIVYKYRTCEFIENINRMDFEENLIIENKYACYNGCDFLEDLQYMSFEKKMKMKYDFFN